MSLADAPMPICRTAAVRSIVCWHLRDRRDTSERYGSRGQRDPLLFPTRRTRRVVFYEESCCLHRVSAFLGHSPRSSSRARILSFGSAPIILIKSSLSMRSFSWIQFIAPRNYVHNPKERRYCITLLYYFILIVFSYKHYFPFYKIQKVYFNFYRTGKLLYY